MGSICAKWLETFCATLNIERRAPSAERRAPSAERRAPSAERRAPSAERRAPSAEAMTAPRAREQRSPPLPPDRLPLRRGGHPVSGTISAARSSLRADRASPPGPFGRGQEPATSAIPSVHEAPGIGVTPAPAPSCAATAAAGHVAGNIHIDANGAPGQEPDLNRIGSSQYA